ncbi:MAG: cytochrome ubiquinol oxidase subunit I [Deltaproteobacteria bacterium]|nr:cytochrome ubiquinol oxidase subunit I [Deltaproteobacteria bacterium]MCL4874609.1 cytochrome ubiquinol oxidase subunit I [bacterium]
MPLPMKKGPPGNALSSPALIIGILFLAASALFPSESYGSAYAPAPLLGPGDYPSVKGLSPRLAVWLAAQMHVWFAAFVLAVPIFVVILEFIGVVKKDARYDRVAYEFLRVSITAFSLTAITGGMLLGALIVFYPGLMRYLASIFGPTAIFYALFFLLETAALYTYYYGWKRMAEGRSKLLHLAVGLGLNISGTGLMFVANAWVTFMMTPSGVDGAGVFSGNLWEAVNNHLWSPMNLHRFIANIAYGGSIVGAYAAYRFLGASNEEERAHYDWMGYTASLIAIGALLPLPFAGYWLTAEIYAFSQQMGITLMGGVFAWLFIIQAVIIGALFLAANYYLWCGFGRGAYGDAYIKYVKYIALVVAASFLVWFTPHTLILTPSEARAIGGQYHPYLGPLGLMPAKNTAVNMMLLFTFLSFILYRRAHRRPVAAWVKYWNALQAGLFTAAVANISFLGVYYGYFTNTVYKVASSVPQVATTLFVIVACLVIEWLMGRGGKREDFKWGRMPERSQYALILIAVSFTWLMGLMGFVRSAIRQHWHVYSIMKDASAEAFTPSIAYAAKVVSTGTIVFLAIVVFIFWLGGMGQGSEAGKDG